MTSLLLVAGVAVVLLGVAVLGWLRDKRAKQPRRPQLSGDERTRRRAAGTLRYHRDVGDSQESSG